MGAREKQRVRRVFAYTASFRLPRGQPSHGGTPPTEVLTQLGVKDFGTIVVIKSSGSLLEKNVPFAVFGPLTESTREEGLQVQVPECRLPVKALKAWIDCEDVVGITGLENRRIEVV
jgi:hypothetical protein